MEGYDTAANFAISDREPITSAQIEVHLAALLGPWSPSVPRQFMPESEFLGELQAYLTGLINLRVNHVRSWLNCNSGRLQGDNTVIEDIRRRFDNMVIEMKSNVQLCGSQCASCHLICIRSRLHDGSHSCNTSHKCAHKCGHCKDGLEQCGTWYVIRSLYQPNLLRNA